MTDTSKPKKLTFVPNTHQETKDRVIAVAWATQQVGGFKGRNVVYDIQKWLKARGYAMPIERIADAMVFLDQGDYGIRVVLGRRTREFIIDDELEVPVPAFVRAEAMRQHATAKAVDPVPVPDPEPVIDRTNGHATTAAAVVAADRHPADMVLPGRGRQMPRLPSSTRSDPDRLDDMLAALRTWYRTDPDACELWIDAVLRDLGVTT